MDESVKWFTLHPKVKAAFVAVAIVALGAGSAAVNGTVSWQEAAVTTATAAFTAAVAYLKSA